MMILDRLTQLAARKGLDDLLLEPIRSHVAVRIDRKGRFLGIEKLPERTWLSLPREALRSSDVVPQLLWDKPPYLLGLSPPGKAVPVAPRRAASIEAHRELAALAPGEIRLQAAAAFVAGKPPKLDEVEDLNYVLFFEDDPMPIGGMPSHDTRSALITMRLHTLETIGRGICPVTGKEDVLVVSNHAKVKPLAGSNAAGGSLVSFDPPSSHSWGHKGTANMPIGRRAYFAYPTALRWLLSNQRIHLTEDHTLVWWSAQEDDVFERVVRDILDGKPELAGEAYRMLEELSRPEGTCCFAVLHGSQGRAHVAYFVDLPKDRVVHALYRHANHYAVGDYHPSLRRILLSSVRHEKRRPLRNVRNSTAMALVRSAIGDGASPSAVAKGAMTELERGLGAGADMRECLDPVRLRALEAIVDNRNGIQRMGDEGLDITRTDTPYLLGGIFAVMEEIQRCAIASIARNKRGGIAERFLREAKNHPARTFSSLFARCRQHLVKMQKRRMPGYYRFNSIYLKYQSKLHEIPTRLSLEGQTLFMLGYDHTRDALRWRKAEVAEASTDGESAQPPA